MPNRNWFFDIVGLLIGCFMGAVVLAVVLGVAYYLLGRFV